MTRIKYLYFLAKATLIAYYMIVYKYCKKTRNTIFIITDELFSLFFSLLTYRMTPRIILN